MYILLFLLILSTSSFGVIITLSSADNFTKFVSNVNKGPSYSEDTVYLGSDITLTETINPIGDSTYQFRGVFDGQGHVISNLKINSSSRYAGLFGYSTGLTVRNLVLDSSCSITSTYSGSAQGGASVGGIIGYCNTKDRKCDIENSVNMADVTFGGRIAKNDNNLYLGGIIGTLRPYSYNAYVKNCVNYGSVTGSGTVDGTAGLGGIIGYSHGSSTYIYIQNCLNYGTITHDKTSGKLIIGGIVGNGYSRTYIENCVSTGKISTPTTAPSITYIGSIVGYVYSDIHINYCYYTSGVNVKSINEYAIFTPSTTGTSGSSTDLSANLVSNLNSNATCWSWNKWLINANNTEVTFKMSDNKELSFSSQVILTPSPVKEGNSFLFWCKEAECTEEFGPEIKSAEKSTTLYAAWVNNIVTFNVSGGDALSEVEATKAVTFNEKYGELPEPSMTGYAFVGWFNESNELITNETIVKTPKNHTLHVIWAPNNYTVSFNVSGGDALSEISKIVMFNEKYGDLPEPTKEGYMFVGWFNESNELITNETIVKIPKNHTLNAHWEEVTTQVEIVFNTKDLTKEDVEKFIEQYTKADFEIVRFEEESGEIRAIIKFVGKEDAEKFVENINKSGGSSDIKQIKFVFDDNSFSAMTHPLSFFSALFL